MRGVTVSAIHQNTANEKEKNYSKIELALCQRGEMAERQPEKEGKVLQPTYKYGMESNYTSTPWCRKGQNSKMNHRIG